ncbi:hypothetical protein [Dokdonella soli]|uniref:Uncharacterized protein n=1 Tax=Dokdonella soli TaxID=529810 RepID=A0ABN1ITU2_9GAMM
MAFNPNDATLGRNDMTDADGNVMTGSVGLAGAPKLKRAAVPGMTDYPANFANAAGGSDTDLPAAEKLGQRTRSAVNATSGLVTGALDTASTLAGAVAKPLGQFAKGAGLVTPSPIAAAGAATLPTASNTGASAASAPLAAESGPPASLSNAAQPALTGSQNNLAGAAAAARAEPGRTVDLGGGNSFSFNGGGNDALARKNLLAGTPALGDAPAGVSLGSGGTAPALSRPALSPQGQLANAQQDYASDIASIINQDPRSVLGNAARNAMVGLSNQRTASRYGGGGSSPAQDAINHLLSGVQANYQTRAGLAAGDQRGNQELALEGARSADAGTAAQRQNQFTLTRDAMTRSNSDRYVVDPATGQYVALNGTKATPVTGADDKPFSITPGGMGLSKEQQNMYDTIYKTSMASPPQIDNPAFNKSQSEDAVKNPAKVAMSEEQIHQMAMQRATGKSQGGQSSQLTGSGPPKEAAEFLRQNPSYRDKFDQKYGPGAAAKTLGS